jgi:hypothetical protein
VVGIHGIEIASDKGFWQKIADKKDPLLQNYPGSSGSFVAMTGMRKSPFGSVR